MQKRVIECEQCDMELERGYEVIEYDHTYFCCRECVEEYILEGEETNMVEVVL